jgi:site-specific recombinase XerD
MIKDIFTSAASAVRLTAGPLGSHLEGWTTALQKQGYAATTIAHHLRAAHAFGCWWHAQHPREELSEPMLERYLADLSSQATPPTAQRRQSMATAIRLWLGHLRQAGLIAPLQAASMPQTAVQQCLTRYQEYLDKVQGLAPRTCQRSLFFAARLLETVSQQGRIEWANFTAEKITAFLLAEVATRKGSGPHGPATALRSFFRLVALREPAHVGQATQVLAIPVKRTDHQLVKALTRAEMEALLAAPDLTQWSGRRDHALLLTLYNSGARVSEIMGLEQAQLSFGTQSVLHLHGKGRKERAVPLWTKTARALQAWCKELSGRPTSLVFLSARGKKLTRNGVD